MQRLRLLSLAAAAFFVVGCAGDLTPEVTDRPMAANAPDPMGHIPQRQESRLGSGSRF